MTPSVATRPTPAPAQTESAQAFRVDLVATRLLQARTMFTTATLDDVDRATQQRYETAAAVALALIDDQPSEPALYAAAAAIASIGDLSVPQRVELVAMVRQAVDRFHEVQAGKHAHAVDRLQSLIDRDRAAMRDGA